MSNQAKVYLFFVISSGGFIILDQFSHFDYARYATHLIVLASTGILAELFEIQFIRHWKISVSIAIYLASIYLGGVELGVIVGVISMFVSEIINRWHNLRQKKFFIFSRALLFNTTQQAITMLATGYVFLLLGAQFPPVRIVDNVAIVLAFAAYEFSNLVLVSIIIALQSKQNMIRLMIENLQHTHIQIIVLGILSVLMGIFFLISPLLYLLSLGLLFVIRMMGQRLIQSHKAQRLLPATFYFALQGQETKTHIREFQSRAGKLGEALKLSDAQIDELIATAGLHSIGIAFLPLYEDGKNQQMIDEAYARKIPTLGADFLMEKRHFKQYAKPVRHLFERFDGSGYPDHSQGEEIPLVSRALAVAHTWVCMTMDCPLLCANGLPSGLNHNEALREMKAMRGKALDPHLVDVFIKTLSS